jgi:hypothetical protein
MDTFDNWTLRDIKDEINNRSTKLKTKFSDKKKLVKNKDRMTPEDFKVKLHSLINDIADLNTQLAKLRKAETKRRKKL